MKYLIDKDVSSYYRQGESNPIKYMKLNILENDFKENIIYPDEIKEQTLPEGAKNKLL
jgi:hypothetical protein